MTSTQQPQVETSQYKQTYGIVGRKMNSAANNTWQYWLKASNDKPIVLISQ